MVPVGIGEFRASKDSREVLVAYGLGSCVGVSIYDPEGKIGGLAHVMLPNSTDALSQSPLGKFADCAVPLLVEEMVKLGARPRRLLGKIAGGAQMLLVARLSNNILNVGERNILAVKAAMELHGIPITRSDTGGHRGRTMAVHLATGKTTVRIVGEKETEL